MPWEPLTVVLTVAVIWVTQPGCRGRVDAVDELEQRIRRRRPPVSIIPATAGRTGSGRSAAEGRIATLATRSLVKTRLIDLMWAGRGGEVIRQTLTADQAAALQASLSATPAASLGPSEEGEQAIEASKPGNA